MSKLNLKQKAFVREFLSDPKRNATQAYIRAGYSAKTAQVASSQLLLNPIIIDMIEKAEERHQKRCDVTIDTLTAEYEEARALAFSTEQPGSMVSATSGKAKLHGLDINKLQVDGQIAIIKKVYHFNAN